MYFLGFVVVAVVQVLEEGTKFVAPFFSVSLALQLVRDFCGSGCACRFGEVPVLSSGLLKKALVFPVAPALFLVFLEANAVRHAKGLVVCYVVCGFTEAGCFSLGFSASGLVGLGTFQEVWRQVLKRLEGHVTEVSSPLSQLNGLPGGWQSVGPIRRWGEQGVPKDFADVPLRGRRNSGKPDWSVITSGSEVRAGIGPEFRLDSGG